MNNRKIAEEEKKYSVVSEICIETEKKDNMLPLGNDASQIHKKEKIFLTKKRQRYKSSQEKLKFHNNQNQNFNMNYMFKFNFNKKGAFNVFEKTQNPFWNYYFNNFQKKPNVNRQSQITLIINNYINIENPPEEIQNNEKVLQTTPKQNYIESPSISTSNSIQAKTILQENSSQKNKFNVIKGNLDENYEKLKKQNENKKRGRKSVKIGKRQHSALDQDNIIRKIQVHFISFIIDFTNDIIQTVYPNNKNLLFKSINYEYKKTVNHSYIQNLFSKNIGEIVQLDASPKNKKFGRDINKIIFDKLSTIENFKKLFQLSYLEMFNKYYYQEPKDIDIFGYKIKLSQRTKFFSDLLGKNKSSSEKIKEITEEYFLPKKDSNPVFVIKKQEIQTK